MASGTSSKVGGFSPVGVMTRRLSAEFTCAVSGVIDYLCACEAHHVPADAACPVIAFDAGRGYCPAGAAEGHDWRATGGRTLATVREWMGRPAS